MGDVAPHIYRFAICICLLQFIPHDSQIQKKHLNISKKHLSTINHTNQSYAEVNINTQHHLYHR